MKSPKPLRKSARIWQSYLQRPD